MTHQPTYRECYICCIFCIFCHCVDILYENLIISEALLNIHEDVRAKPFSWIVVAWMPVIDEEKSRRHRQDYESNAARNTRLYQKCWRRFLGKWPEFTKHARLILFGDGKARISRHSLGAFLGDQQVKRYYVLHILHIVYSFAYLT